MSSAVLYVAIVVIWACVLIPRWLRRESSHASPVADKTAGEVAPGDAASGDGPSGFAAPGSVASGGVASSGAASDAVAFGEDVGESAVDRQEDAAGGPPKQDEAPPPPPLTPEESRRRMLAARRRLFGMLMALEVAAIALAVFGMAALWVVIPPSVMLGWYMLLLREAARADAERASHELEAVHARARARERARARAGPAAREPVAAAAGPASVAGAGSAGTAGSAAGYEDAGPGRDFAPGLAGKYITSNAEVIDISARTEDYYQHATENKLRAVGD